MRFRTQPLKIIKRSLLAGRRWVRVLSCWGMLTGSIILRNLQLVLIIGSKKLHMVMLLSTWNSGIQLDKNVTELLSIIISPSRKLHVLSSILPTKIHSPMLKPGYNNLYSTAEIKFPKYCWEIKVTYYPQ